MFGERLKELREEHEMKQIDLAKILNVSRQSISAYESNTNDPSLAALTKIADLFGVSADYLLSRTKERENLNILDKTNKEIMFKLYSIIKDYKLTKK